MAERRDLLLGGAVLGLSLALYVYTAAPTVSYGGDCGELTAAAAVLGVAHPTGYPLYLLLGRLFAALPVGDVAYRLNVMSGVWASLAVAGLFGLLREITGQRAAALFGAATLACGHVFWSQAVIAEVYTLNAFFVVLVLLLSWRWARSRDARWLYGLGLAYGLGAGNHVSLLQWLPLSLLYVALVERQGPALLRSWARCLAGLLPGLLLYLYLPLRASLDPPLNWGDPATWPRFVRHVTAQTYRDNLFALSAAEVLAHALRHGQWAVRQLWLTLGVALWGIVALARRERRYAGFLFLAGSLNVAFYLNYKVGDQQNYFLPTYVLVCLAAGGGASALLQTARTAFVRFPRLGLALAAMVLTLLPLSQLRRTGAEATLRGNDHARQYAEAVLRAVPEEAVLLVESDEALFSMWYLQHVEHWKPTLTTVGLADLTQPTGRTQMWQKIQTHLEQRPVYAAFWDNELAARYALVPRGPVCEVRRKFPPPRSWTAAVPRTVRAEFDDGLVLVSASLSAAQIKPLTVAEVECHWAARRPPTRRWSAILLLTLQDQVQPMAFVEARRWWMVTNELGRGGRPTSEWAVGKHVVERYSISPPQEAVPGKYELRVGLIPTADAGAQTRLPRDRTQPMSLSCEVIPK
jgi:hypothetical protein